MAGITGLSTTFNLPNYHGELMALTPEETPLLSAAGGLNGGGKQATSTSFEWQDYDLRDPQIRTRLEGGDAPTAEARVRANHDNIVQIFHESVSAPATPSRPLRTCTPLPATACPTRSLPSTPGRLRRPSSRWPAT